MAIEIVDFPVKHGDFPLQNFSSPEGTCRYLQVPEEMVQVFKQLRPDPSLMAASGSTDLTLVGGAAHHLPVIKGG